MLRGPKMHTQTPSHHGFWFDTLPSRDENTLRGKHYVDSVFRALQPETSPIPRCGVYVYYATCLSSFFPIHRRTTGLANS